MKAAVFNADGGIELAERAVPEPQPGWVRVAIGAGGICGSDLHLLHGQFGPNVGVQPGHEMMGVVDAAGDGSSVAAGTTVAVEPIVGCGACDHCAAGRPNLCSGVHLFGFTLPGGLAEYVSVPESAVHPLPATLSRKAAALSEPMAVCVRGVRIGDVGAGDRVAILGAGSIGLLSIVTARAAGAAEVLITARHPHQQDLARALGADRVFGSDAELVAAVGDQHVDVVLETVGGTAGTLTEAVGVARTGGTIVMIGVFDGEPSIPGYEFFRRELTLKASNCYGREAQTTDFALATELVVTHSADIEHLVTHTFSLDQVAEAFATAQDKSTRSIKVQIHA